MAKSLKNKAVSGVMWTALQRYSTLFIQFVSGIILARLLTPYDYGCIGMLTIFITLAEVFIDSGFGSALIQKKRPTQEDYSTIFFWNLGMAFFLYAVLFFTAPLIARFYKIPLLSNVLRVQGIVLFIYAFNIVQRNQLQKKLHFRVLSIVSIATSITALAITIFMAYSGFGVWSLVTQNIILAAIPTFFFWFYVKWRPIRVFSKKSFIELFSFGGYMFLTQLVTRFGQQIRGLFIGKLYNASTMGYYSKAFGTEKLASHSISQVLGQVTYPIYAEIQDDKARMINVLKQMSSSVAYLTFPFLLILILVAKPLFILLYSDRWLESVPYFQIICIGGIANCLQSVNLQTISAIGKSRVMFIWAVIKQGIGLVLVILGLYLSGIYGLLWGAVLHSWICTYINMYLVSKYIGYKLSTQVRDLLPIAIISVVAFITGYLVNITLNFGLYADGALSMLTFIAVYATLSVVFKLKAFTFLLNNLVLRRTGKKTKRTKDGDN